MRHNPEHRPLPFNHSHGLNRAGVTLTCLLVSVILPGSTAPAFASATDADADAGAGGASDGAGGGAPPRWEVSAAVSSGTPAVLPGLSLGVTGEVERRISTLPLFVSARLQWTSASAANESWIIDHQQFVAAIGGGVAATLGAGRVWAQAGGGASGLYEVLSRPQLQRIQNAGVSGGTETSFSLGPTAFAEVGVAVRMRLVNAFVAGGPTAARTLVDGSGRWRAGGATRLGISYDF